MLRSDTRAKGSRPVPAHPRRHGPRDSCARRDISECNRRLTLPHMIEETARRAGHADITRETLDGPRAGGGQPRLRPPWPVFLPVSGADQLPPRACPRDPRRRLTHCRGDNSGPGDPRCGAAAPRPHPGIVDAELERRRDRRPGHRRPRRALRRPGRIRPRLTDRDRRQHRRALGTVRDR